MLQKFTDWLEMHFAPIMSKLNRNVWILTLKDSMMQILPMILVGSLITLAAVVQGFIPQIPNLWPLYGYTMGMLSLFIAFLIPFNFMEKKKMHKLRLVAGMVSLSLFLIVIKFDDLPNLKLEYFGAGGMIVSIFSGIYVCLIMGWFGKFSFFNEDSAIPDFVKVWFDVLIPVTLIVASGWIAVYILNVDIYNIIQSIFKPVANIAQTFYGFVFIVFIYCFLYSMGISTWILTPIMMPIMLAAINENTELVAAGSVATHITTQEVIFSGWLAVGGMGSTLPLVIFLMLSKAKRLKALGSASFVPSIFNINEPVVFGCIAWNPVLMVPMWLQGIITPALTYTVLKMGLVTIPSSVFNLWWVPFPLSTWMVSQDIRAMILLAAVTLISAVIWYPFFKVYERQQLAIDSQS